MVNRGAPIRDRVRVLWVIKGLGPGGAEQLLVQAARAGDHTRFEYHVAYAVAAKDQFVSVLTETGVMVHPLAHAADRGPRWLVRLARLLRNGDFDVVHTHSPLLAGMVRLLVRCLPRRRRPELLYTEHNRWGQYRRSTRWLNAATYPLEGTVLAVSEGVRQTVARRLRDRVVTLHHGIDLDHVRHHAGHRASVREELGVADEQVLVGTIANLRREKAYEDLLDAAGLLLQRRDNVRFVSVGQGPLEAELRQRHAQLGLGEGFRFLGYRPDALRLLAGFDLFVLSSHHEGLPVAVMEAQALGTPIVATAVGGLPEAVTDGIDGVLVPPARPAELADAIDQLASDPERRQRMQVAARRSAERFDVVRAVQALEERYVEAAVTRGGGR